MGGRCIHRKPTKTVWTCNLRAFIPIVKIYLLTHWLVFIELSWVELSWVLLSWVEFCWVELSWVRFLQSSLCSLVPIKNSLTYVSGFTACNYHDDSDYWALQGQETLLWFSLCRQTQGWLLSRPVSPACPLFRPMIWFSVVKSPLVTVTNSDAQMCQWQHLDRVMTTDTQSEDVSSTLWYLTLQSETDKDSGGRGRMKRMWFHIFDITKTYLLFSLKFLVYPWGRGGSRLSRLFHFLFLFPPPPVGMWGQYCSNVIRHTSQITTISAPHGILRRSQARWERALVPPWGLVPVGCAWQCMGCSNHHNWFLTTEEQNESVDTFSLVVIKCWKETMRGFVCWRAKCFWDVWITAQFWCVVEGRIPCGLTDASCFVPPPPPPSGHDVHGAHPGESASGLGDWWSVGATPAAPQPAPRLRPGPHEVSEPGQWGGGNTNQQHTTCNYDTVSIRPQILFTPTNSWPFI